MHNKKEFIVGYQAVREILSKQPYRVVRCFLLNSREDSRIRELLDLINLNKINLLYKNRQELDALLGSTNHQGVALECHTVAPKSEAFLEDLLLKNQLLLLFLDGVQDPHNLGAIIRTANAMGVDAVIAPKDRACGLTEVVHKTACGATAHTPFIQITNLARTLRQTREASVDIIGLDAQSAMTIGQVSAAHRIALVVGGEGKGLRRLTREHCDSLVSIPMRGTVQSLNVSVATAIGLYVITGNTLAS